jgi:ABC-type multidrug transport system fused ATPase/permease subunit
MRNAGSANAAGTRSSGVLNLELYHQIAYIPQDPPIFDGTLRENLTLDEPAEDYAIQNPKIIILDEPTSALDSLTESFVT